MKELPSQEYLLATFRYDDATGLLYWRNRTDAPPKWNGRYADTVVGNVERGRVNVVLTGIGRFKAHRIIWKMVYGTDPAMIDHRDGDGTNNRLSNLRECSHAENMRNMKGHSNSGYKGAYLHKQSGLWRAEICVNRDTKYLGYFKTPQAAHEAYVAAAKLYFGEFARAA